MLDAVMQQCECMIGKVADPLPVLASGILSFTRFVVQNYFVSVKSSFSGI
jgi:hypothetical protein